MTTVRGLVDGRRSGARVGDEEESVRSRVGLRRFLGRSGIVAVLCVSGCSRNEPPGPARPGDEPLQITQGFTTTESDSGVVRYVLRARVARFYEGDVTRAEDVEVDFYERGQKVSVLRAEAGFVDGDGRLRARGNVVVTSVEGAVLTTDELYWDRTNGKIRAEGPFRIVEKGEPLTGVGLTTDPDLTLFEVDRDVEGTHVVRPQEAP